MKHMSVLSFCWYQIKPYKWFYVVMLLAPLTSAFYPFMYNYAIKLFLDAMTQEGPLTYHHIIVPIGLFLSLSLLTEVIWRIAQMAGWKSEPYVRRSILLQSYDYVQHHSYTFFQNNFTGTLSSKLKGLLDGYDKVWVELSYGLFLKILKSTVNLFALVFISPMLGFFVFLWCTVYVPIMYKLSKKLNGLSFEETQSRHDLIGQVSDKIMNIISLFSFASRKREFQGLDRQITRDSIPKQIRVAKYDFKMQIVAGIFYLIMTSFILFYMIHLKMKGAVSVGDFAFVFGIFTVLSQDIWDTTVSMQELSRTLGDFKSSLSILNIPHQNQDMKDAIPLKIDTPKIEFKDLTFKYDSGEILFKDLNLTINPGENVGLVGHSGAGKSSLVNLMLRYFKNDQGEILIDEQNINKVTEDSLREHIAVIPQDTMLFHRTLMENIQYGNPHATEAQVIEASKKAHIHEFIMELPEKYQSYVGERGLKLSGGQRQRIAIARAILKKAPILILDEATSSLDSQTEQFIQEGLNFFLDDEKKTVIAIAHRLSTLRHMDRILVLDKGKIVEQGTHTQLIRDPKSLYSKLWKLQEI